MLRIRLLRVLFPVILLGLAGAIVFAVRCRPQGGFFPTESSSDSDARMEGFRFSDLVGGRRRLLLQARVGRVDDQGGFDVENVERVEVDREGQSPLIMTAKRGAGSGAQGKRLVRLEGGVTVHDEGAGLGLEIPTVEVDQVAGVVRSVGSVRMTSNDWSGTASGVIYSLTGEPARLTDLELTGPKGGRVVANRASIPEGARTLTLADNVEAAQEGTVFRADEVVVTRTADGTLESLTARPEVRGTLAKLGGGPATFVAREVRARWGSTGAISDVGLSGEARVRHARGAIAADRIDAKAVDGGSYAVDASGHVVASGMLQKGPGELSCDVLAATIDGQGVARDGTAKGSVRFDGDGAAGEADRAEFTAQGTSGMVTLRASETRRARLASGRMRVVAETIVSDLRGIRMRADDKVETALLPALDAQKSGVSGMFRPGEAVHFVSKGLESENAGARVLLRGDVRGWQGERTLSADEVEMIREGEVLNAKGRVATRMPREASHAAVESDYVQIASERLSYHGAAHTARYEGDVRVRQAEGWLQAPLLVATLADDGSGLREAEASRGARFEYRSPGDRGVPTTAAGEGDRVVFDAGARVLRVFGDKAPATVRSSGPKGGTTVGRVLRYDLESGSLEVESGERDRAIIRTPKE
jgi:lipopolysaccharide export system protein LptA